MHLVGFRGEHGSIKLVLMQQQGLQLNMETGLHILSSGASSMSFFVFGGVLLCPGFGGKEL